jgi:hypothetical protein
MQYGRLAAICRLSTQQHPASSSMEHLPMRTSVVLSIAVALTAVAIGSSGAAFATSRTSAPVVRDHRAPAPVIRDHRTPVTPVIRDHRTPATPVIRDHRPVSQVISVQPLGRKVIRLGRLYDKGPNRVQVVVNGKRVPRRVVR